jgi:hypothetical protein
MAVWGRSNNVQTTLSGPMLIGDTTCTVTSATGLPATPFPITVCVVTAGVATNLEIMLVTGVASTTLTVTRAQEGTSAVAHASGEVVAQTVTAAAFANLPYLAAGGLAVSSNVLDTAAAGTLSLGTATATAIRIAAAAVLTTILGGVTVQGGAVSITGNAASSLTTSAGALTVTSAAAAIWSTSAGALTLDSAAALNLGTSTATSIAMGASGITTTITGGLTQLTGAVSLTGNAASQLSTSSGALTITSAAAATWSTAAGALAISSAAALNLNAASGSVVALQVNGASIVTVSNNTISLAVAGTSYTLSQVAASSGAGNNFTIAPQAPTTTGAAGSLVVNVQAPASGTAEAGIFLQRNTTAFAYLQPLVSTPANGALYLGPTAPTATNYAITGTGTNVTVNGGGQLVLAVAGATQLVLGGSVFQLNKPLAYTSTGVQFAKSSAIALTTGTTTISAPQQATTALQFTGTLTGANTIAINGSLGLYFLDFTGVTIGAQSVTITNGAGSFTATTLLATKPMLVVYCYSTSTLAVA